MYSKIINTTGRHFSRLGILGCLLLTANSASWAQTLVKGFVRDAITKKPIAFVTVMFKDGKGITSDANGSYSIESKNTKLTTLVFSYVGYNKETREIVPGVEQTLDIFMELSSAMKEVVVKRGRGKYRNKNNPAVELIEKVIANKERNRLSAYDYVQNQQYEKIELSLANKPEKLMNNRLFRSFRFMMENIDSTSVPGKALLPIYIEEKIQNNYYRRNPRAEKVRILGEKQVNYGDFIDNSGISSYIRSLYADIDIYQNTIPLLQQQFMSPIADVSPAFYRYYIIDTSEYDGIKLIRLNFTPKNPTDLIFRGTMYITLDGNYSIQKINMTISKRANVNWTRDLQIRQEFEKGPDGRYHVILSDMITEFELVKNTDGSMYGERLVSFKNFKINEPAPDSIYNGKDEINYSSVLATNDSFWLTNRHTPLSRIEAKTYSNIDSLKNTKKFKTFMTVVTGLFTGFVVLGPYEIGNTNTFYSFNPVEGFRLRLGGRSTDHLSPRFYFENYVAYGFKDKRFKYALNTTYSFNGKSIYTYPMHFLRLGYQYEMKIPGQELQFVQEDNFLLSFKRGINDRWMYNRIIKGEYVHEFGKNFMLSLGYKNTETEPGGSIFFQKSGSPANDFVKGIQTTEISGEIRWAPNEQFYQGKNFRVPIINKYPIFKLRYIAGIKGLTGGQYNYHNLNLYAEKRFFMSQFGFTDITMEGGYIFGQVPFPLLTIHRANQTFSYQLNSYNLMNFLEFVSDRFYATHFDLHLNGFLLNKIPLMKKLKWREVASAKILFGSLRDENNPAKSNNVFNFMKDKDGNTATYTLDRGPYIEVSIGLANIFKLVRLDLVRRLTYLDNPNISTWGLRTRVRFEF